MGAQCAKGRSAFLRIVPEIVDHGNGCVVCAHDIEAACEPLERAQRFDRCRYGHACCSRTGNGGERIREIVPPGHIEAQGVLACVMPVDDHRSLAHRPFRDTAGDDAYLRLFLLDAEGDRFLRMGQEGKRFGVVGIDDRDPAAREIVAEQLAQLFHALVVEADVEQHAHRRAIQRDRTVAFVDLADIEALPADHGAGKGTLGRDEVLHHRAIHDGGRASGGFHDPAEHSGHGRLAAGPGHRDPGTAGVEQDGVQFGTRQAQASKIVRLADFRHGVLDRGRGDHDLVSRNDAAAVLRMKLEALLLKRCEFLRRTALVEASIRTCNGRSASFQDLCKRQHSGPADADEEERTGEKFIGAGEVGHCGLAMQL